MINAHLDLDGDIVRYDQINELVLRNDTIQMKCLGAEAFTPYDCRTKKSCRITYKLKNNKAKERCVCVLWIIFVATIIFSFNYGPK